MRDAADGKTKKSGVAFAVLLPVLLAAFAMSVGMGSVYISPSELWQFLWGGSTGEPGHDIILTHFRIPKSLTALAAGAGLAVSGLQMQTLFRNPLAGPFVLGISSGAGLGVAVIIFLGFRFGYLINLSGLGRNWMNVLAAGVGSFLVLLVILLSANRLKDGVSLLIIGLMFGTVAGALVSVLQFFSRAENIQAYVLWSFGSLGGVSAEELAILIPILVFGLFITFLLSKSLNALMLGDNYAVSIGLNLKNARLFIIFNTSLLAGTITAFCGPISFIGLAVPHLARMIFNTSNHLLLSPLVILVGAVLMLIFDVISQVPGSDITLPVNAVTALFGAPFVIWIILRKKSVNYS